MGQNATQYKEAQRIGSVKLLISDYGASSYTDLGIGKGFAFQETINSLSGEPDNGEQPDILIGIAKQTAEITGTLWTQEWDNIKQMRGDIDVKTTSAVDGSEVYTTGGLSAQSNVIVRAEQRTTRAATANDVLKYVTTPSSPVFTFGVGDSVTFLTTWEFHKCNYTGGENVAPPADTDETSIIEYPFAFSSIEDSTRSDGDKLFSRTLTVEDPSA